MRLTAMDFYKELFQELDPDKLLQKFLQLLLEVQDVERGSLWIKDRQGYYCAEAAGADSEKVRGLALRADESSIVGWVIENGETTIAEAGRDPRHHSEIEQGFEVPSGLILCYPLVLSNGDVYGAVELIETQTGGKKLNLSKDFLEVLQSLIDLGAVALGNALNFADKLSENIRLKQTIDEIAGGGPIIGQSPAFLEVLKKVRDFARTDFPVMITGESGTGKELIAREIHRGSTRQDQPFFVQNCSAIPDTLLESELFGYKKGAFTGADSDKTGLFEAAHGGTVFLDEIGDMPQGLQAKILRVLQNKEIKPLGETGVRKVDVRVLAATNMELKQGIKDGRFREDLFFRLSVLPLHLPPLRERREDIPLLLNHFLAREAAQMGAASKTISGPAMARLMDNPWRGNIRELENFAKYILATVTAEVLHEHDMPSHLLGSGDECAPAGTAAAQAGDYFEDESTSVGPAPGAPSSFDGYTWEKLEHDYVAHLLSKYKWNVTKAAESAGVKRSTFCSRMKRLGIDRN